MNKLQALFDLCDEEGILIDYNYLPNNILGLYIKKPNLPTIIGIDKSIENNKLKLIEILSEELGHHFTTTGEFVGPFYHYKDRINLNKIEEKAIRWATEFLIPLDEFMRTIKQGISSMNDLIESLELPREIIMSRLMFLSRQYEFIKIDNNKSLVLNSYPNVYIYENI